MSNDDEKPMVGSYRPKSRRCCVVSVLSVSLVLILVLCIAIPLGVKNSKNDDGDNGVNVACQATEYPEACRESVAGSDGTPVGMSRSSVKSSTDELSYLQANTTDEQCKEILADGVAAFQRVLVALETTNHTLVEEICADVQTDLSAVLTYVDTCKEMMQESGSAEFHSFVQRALKSEQFTGNSLALINGICLYGGNLKNWAGKNFGVSMPDLDQFYGGGPSRRLMNADPYNDEGEEIQLPSWMDSATSRHLLTRPASYNVIVAKDGSGKYRTVGEAIMKAPKTGDKYAKRYVIYVKAGVYDEQIIIPKKLTNLMIIGDGIDKTIFTGSRNVALMKGMTTYLSGTMIVQGDGFVGRLFTCRNTAGASGHQAVATRVTADKVAFHRVKFDGFQDTLYCHALRQFYRDCVVIGTVDFIFGNANAVFQNCQIIARKTTLRGQQNTYTAQGRVNKYQNTGLAFQDCNFDGTADLKRNVQYYPTYLGRPWKAYSVCVLLRPTIQAHLDPAGWLPWNTTNFGLYTSFFAEYKGKGPGSNRRSRVKWSHEIKNPRVANRYQAASFINGKSWITNIGMPYTLQPV